MSRETDLLAGFWGAWRQRRNKHRVLRVSQVSAYYFTGGKKADDFLSAVNTGGKNVDDFSAYNFTGESAFNDFSTYLFTGRSTFNCDRV
jgi:hypothetical protein